MGLVDYVTNAVQRIKASFSSDKVKWRDYLENYELKKYFHKDLSEEERARLRGHLEEIVDKKVDQYDKQLNSLVRKAASKSTMSVGVANDIYSIISNTAPLLNIVYFRGLMYRLKTIAEAPAPYKYIKQSKDWYGPQPSLQ